MFPRIPVGQRPTVEIDRIPPSRSEFRRNNPNKLKRQTERLLCQDNGMYSWIMLSYTDVGGLYLFRLL